MIDTYGDNINTDGSEKRRLKSRAGLDPGLHPGSESNRSSRDATQPGWEKEWIRVPGPAGSLELRVTPTLFLVFDAAVRGRLLGWSGSTKDVPRARRLLDDPSQHDTVVGMWDLAHLSYASQYIDDPSDLAELLREVLSLGERTPKIRGLASAVGAALHESVPSCLPAASPAVRSAQQAGRLAVFLQRAGSFRPAADLWQVCALRWSELRCIDEMASLYEAAAAARVVACLGRGAIEGIDDVGEASGPEAHAVRRLHGLLPPAPTEDHGSGASASATALRPDWIRSDQGD